VQQEEQVMMLDTLPLPLQKLEVVDLGMVVAGGRKLMVLGIIISNCNTTLVHPTYLKGKKRNAH